MIERIRRWFRGRRALRRQTTFVYCPGCGLELCAGGRYLGPTSTADGRGREYETFECADCGLWSAWDFDMPAPRMAYTATTLT